MSETHIYIGHVIFQAREEVDTNKLFLECQDKNLHHLFKNGTVDKESFLETFDKVEMGISVKRPSFYDDVLYNIIKPYGPMPFYRALQIVTNANVDISRKGWNGKDLKVRYNTPKQTDTVNQNHFVIIYPDGKVTPWVPSQSDLIAEDWMVV